MPPVQRSRRKGGKRRPCSNEDEYIDKTGTCRVCPHCPNGEKWSDRCGWGISSPRVACVSCSSGRYSNANSPGERHTCAACDDCVALGRIFESQCSSDQNAVCSSHCRPGFRDSEPDRVDPLRPSQCYKEPDTPDPTTGAKGDLTVIIAACVPSLIVLLLLGIVIVKYCRDRRTTRRRRRRQDSGPKDEENPEPQWRAPCFPCVCLCCENTPPEDPNHPQPGMELQNLLQGQPGAGDEPVHGPIEDRNAQNQGHDQPGAGGDQMHQADHLGPAGGPQAGHDFPPGEPGAVADPVDRDRQNQGLRADILDPAGHVPEGQRDQPGELGGPEEPGANPIDIDGQNQRHHGNHIPPAVDHAEGQNVLPREPIVVADPVDRDRQNQGLRADILDPAGPVPEGQRDQPGELDGPEEPGADPINVDGQNQRPQADHVGPDDGRVQDQRLRAGNLDPAEPDLEEQRGQLEEPSGREQPDPDAVIRAGQNQGTQADHIDPIDPAVAQQRGPSGHRAGQNHRPRADHVNPVEPALEQQPGEPHGLAEPNANPVNRAAQNQRPQTEHKGHADGVGRNQRLQAENLDPAHPILEGQRKLPGQPEEQQEPAPDAINRAHQMDAIGPAVEHQHDHPAQLDGLNEPHPYTVNRAGQNQRPRDNPVNPHNGVRPDLRFHADNLGPDDLGLVLQGQRGWSAEHDRLAGSSPGFVYWDGRNQRPQAAGRQPRQPITTDWSDPGAFNGARPKHQNGHFDQTDHNLQDLSDLGGHSSAGSAYFLNTMNMGELNSADTLGATGGTDYVHHVGRGHYDAGVQPVEVPEGATGGCPGPPNGVMFDQEEFLCPPDSSEQDEQTPFLDRGRARRWHGPPVNQPLPVDRGRRGQQNTNHENMQEPDEPVQEMPSTEVVGARSQLPYS